MSRQLKIKKTKHLSKNDFNNCLAGTISKRVSKHLSHCTHCKSWLRYRERKREELTSIISGVQAFHQHTPSHRLREEVVEDSFPRLLSQSEWNRLKNLSFVTAVSVIITVATLNIIICPNPGEGIPPFNWASIAIFSLTISWLVHLFSTIGLDREDDDD